MTPEQPPQPAPAGGQPMAGPPPVTIDAVIQLLRDDRMRGFRIDIETDSLVESDQQAEKASANELIASIGGFFKEFGPIVAQMPPLAPMASQLLCFALRRYKVGAELEEIVEKSMQEVVQRLENPPPPQPDPTEQAKLEGIKTKAAAEGNKAQVEGQIAQMEANFKQQEMAMKAQAEQQKAAMDAQAQKMDMVLKLLEHRQAGEQMAREEERSALEHERAKEMIEHKAKEAQKPKDNDK